MAGLFLSGPTGNGESRGGATADSKAETGRKAGGICDNFRVVCVVSGEFFQRANRALHGGVVKYAKSHGASFRGGGWMLTRYKRKACHFSIVVESMSYVFDTAAIRH